MMTATICPWDAKYPCVTWRSTNPDVATVNENGLVMGVAPGIAMIVATSADGTEISDYCHVTVGEREITRDCIEMIKFFEGFRESPIQVGGDWYIGHGHKILPGEDLTLIDRQAAAELMYADITKAFMPTLDKFLADNHIALNEKQYEACISYSYSVGCYCWDEPDRKLVRFLKAKVNFNNYDAVFDAFYNGKDNYNRRRYEAELFVNGTYHY